VIYNIGEEKAVLKAYRKPPELAMS